MELYKRLQNELTKIEVNPGFTPGQRKKLGEKAIVKYFNKPAAAFESEQIAINNALASMVAGVQPDGHVLMFTKMVEECIKAKEPHKVVMLLSMYNKGLFDSVLQPNPQMPGESSGIVDLRGNDLTTGK